MADHPFDECVITAKKWIDQGSIIHQKFTCDKCGSRQTMAEANILFTTGKCEECEHVTDIQAKGCNYLVVTRMSHTEQEKGNA